MSHGVTIRTGARLHFGLWGIHAPTGPQFGGVGMMIAHPGVELTARPAERDEIASPSVEVTGRIERFLQRLRDVRPDLPPVAIEVAAAIDSHQGLGSGTQLGLATATAVFRLAGEWHFAAADWAHRLGRAERSSIGVHGFGGGGFLVEAGQLPDDDIGTLIGRADVDPEWRIVLVAPRQTAGLSGVAELTAFQQLPPMNDSTTTQLSRLAVDEWWPAMEQRDFAMASRTMWDYGQLAGDYFRTVQGGVFASPTMAALSHDLRAMGYDGIAQTSWGPTIAVLCRDAEQAEAVRQRVESRDETLSVRITAPLNQGASLESSH
jgi:beta-ribofuranosylaminobenzene 5'-phosphate synthase